MFTLFLSDVILLQKCLKYSRNDAPSIKVLDSANTTASIFFMQTLISKIFEMWMFLTKNKILSKLQKSSLALMVSSGKIESFFSDNRVLEVFKFIRNNIGFHYAYTEDIDNLIDEIFNEFADNEFEMWLSLDGGNNLFVSATTSTISVIIKKMQALGFQGDDRSRMEELFTLAFKGAELFQDFSNLFLIEGFGITWDKKETVEVEAPVISAVKLPLVVAKQ